MPPGLVEQQHGVGARRDFGGDLGEVEAHRLGVARWQDETGALALLRADGSEDVGRGGALVVRRAGARSAPGPAAGDLVLLADARLVGEPDLYPGQGNAFVSRNRVEQGREFFLNSSMSSMRCA